MIYWKKILLLVLSLDRIPISTRLCNLDLQGIFGDQLWLDRLLRPFGSDQM